MDDIIDSGTTKAEYARLFPGKPFLALIDKTSEEMFYSEGHPDHGTLPVPVEGHHAGQGLRAEPVVCDRRRPVADLPLSRQGHAEDLTTRRMAGIGAVRT